MPLRFRLLSAAVLALAVVSTGVGDPPPEVWWSFRLLVRPLVPATTNAATGNPIDAFIRAKLTEKNLSPAPEADRRTLIRRVTLDLTGLPPTPDAIRAFLADSEPLAYERLVDRLLASPAYGERQARQWMDAVHFAETNGHETDGMRPNAWRYRDYLVAAFNADTPYARFIQEQVAADALFPEEPWLTPALGFIAAGPWDESSLRGINEDSLDRVAGHYLDRDDMVTTVIATTQSLTVHCARCHDHKFDPIGQTDYYGLQAVFAGVDRADRVYEPDPAVGKRRAELRVKLAEAVVATLAVPADARAAAPLFELGTLPVREKAAAEVKSLPPPAFVYAGTHDFKPEGNFKPSKKPRPVNVLKRGDVRRPGPVAHAAALTCLPAVSGKLDVPDVAPESQRRAALAIWLTRDDNPLTWRSIVNRAWQSHFGHGIVDTPNDFGKMGSEPSHPELLDWLAADFRDSGGSLKRLHRLIVTSATCRAASGFTTSDPDNRVLAHMPRGRLDAEQVRDAILQVSGRLDLRMGGPSDQQFKSTPVEGRPAVVDYPAFAWDRPEGHRRSIYRFSYRTLADPFVECLDGADAAQLTPVRNVSITGPQALALLNNDFVLTHSKALAALVEAEATRPRRQVELACERVWGRPPTSAECKEFVTFVRQYGLANLCRVLFNSNEFLFVD
jgi:hypothetical protein